MGVKQENLVTNKLKLESSGDVLVRALASHQCGPGSISRHQMWVEFVGSLLCSERFYPGYTGFPLPSKTCI